MGNGASSAGFKPLSTIDPKELRRLGLRPKPDETLDPEWVSALVATSEQAVTNWIEMSYAGTCYNGQGTP